MTLNEIKTAVYAGQRVYWADKGHEVVHDNVGQWLIRCVDGNDCFTGLTWTDGKTLNGKPEEFFTDDPKKSVKEILRETAKALRDNGHGCVTTPLFWDCECATDSRMVSWSDECPICGARADDQPDSRLHEVLDEMAVAYGASPLDGRY